MDCASGRKYGFVAVANHIDEEDDMARAIEGSSPVFQITGQGEANLVLTFATPYQNTIHFWYV